MHFPVLSTKKRLYLTGLTYSLVSLVLSFSIGGFKEQTCSPDSFRVLFWQAQVGIIQSFPTGAREPPIFHMNTATLIRMIHQCCSLSQNIRWGIFCESNTLHDTLWYSGKSFTFRDRVALNDTRAIFSSTKTESVDDVRVVGDDRDETLYTSLGTRVVPTTSSPIAAANRSTRLGPGNRSW